MEPTLPTLIPRYKIWIETSDSQGILGDGKWILLKTIQQTGTLTAAVEKLGITYRKTWNNIKKIEKILGFPLLETKRGGSEGGASVLTVQGQMIVKAFDRFHAGFDEKAQQAFMQFLQDMEAVRELK
jgi:molybdate transport system regulatory protein